MAPFTGPLQVPFELNVQNGRYFALLGDKALHPFLPVSFLIIPVSFLKVSVDLKDGEGMRPSCPDQPITATPLALAAEYAGLQNLLPLVRSPGICYPQMSWPTLTAPKPFLPLNPAPLLLKSPPVPSLTNYSAPAVLADLNSSISQITREMLPPSVLADLNKSITRSDLPPSVLADLNRTITRDSFRPCRFGNAMTCH